MKTYSNLEFLNHLKDEIINQLKRFNDYGKEIDDIKFIVGEIKKK